MNNPQFVDEVASRLKDLLAHGPGADLDRNIRAILASAFTKLNLVTREEFEVQQEVLSRTRAKLAELEAKLAALEAQSASPMPGSEPPRSA